MEQSGPISLMCARVRVCRLCRWSSASSPPGLDTPPPLAYFVLPYTAIEPTWKDGQVVLPPICVS